MTTESEFSYLHTIYMSIVQKEMGHPAPLPEQVQEVLNKTDSTSPSQPVSEPGQQWLGLLDMAVQPQPLRSYLKEHDVGEPALQAMIRFLVAKKSHSQADRDKVDWLVTHLFKVREEQSNNLTGWVKSAMEDILKGIDFSPLSADAQASMAEIPALLDEVRYFESFSQITDSRIIQRGRELKNQFGEEFFHPDVLTPIVNYNLLFGKIFHAMLQETMQKVHNLTRSQPDSNTPDAAELLRSDYRSTADAFRQLTELGREQESKKTAANARADSAQTDPGKSADEWERQMKNVGVDPAIQAVHLRNRMQELTVRLRAKQTVTSIPMFGRPLALNDWESSAFRTEYAESEQTFRVEFAHSLCHTISIISRVQEELNSYREKKNTEYLWKKHYDALLYLLYEGRRHKDTLARLSSVSQQKGLLEKSKQLLLTAEKLETTLSEVAAIF
ncbi:MAG: hypothetical protein O7E51_05830 [Acidobacteria bacterium]|nr:hypothetical protein [Acidobacteriota bacterium]